MNRTEVFQKLRELGATSAILRYEGGNDEGHIEDVELYDGKRYVRSIEDPQSYGGGMMVVRDEAGHTIYEEVELHSGGTRREAKLREMTPSEKETRDLVEALGDPVWEAYGSFAGDFFVSGKVEWDADTKSVYMDGGEV